MDKPQQIGTTQLDLMNYVFKSIVALANDIQNFEQSQDHDCENNDPDDGCKVCAEQREGV